MYATCMCLMYLKYMRYVRVTKLVAHSKLIYPVICFVMMYQLVLRSSRPARAPRAGSALLLSLRSCISGVRSAPLRVSRSGERERRSTSTNIITYLYIMYVILPNARALLLEKCSRRVQDGMTHD